MCSHVSDLNAKLNAYKNTVKLLKQGYRFHKLRKVFVIYHRHHELGSKFKVGLKNISHLGLSKQEFMVT